MLTPRLRLLIALLLLAFLGALAAILGIAGQPPAAPPTLALAQVQTEAVQAFIAELTASAPNPKSPGVPSAVSTPTAGTTPSGTPTCLGLRFLRDVTIPDNTEMTPAEVFTKTWLVQNSGTCTWKPGFRVVLIGGTAMGGSPFKVAQTVGPGGSIQISIKMVAPTNQTGVVQGTWKMTDENAEQFGDYLSVVIVISGQSGAVTASPSAGVP